MGDVRRPCPLGLAVLCFAALFAAPAPSGAERPQENPGDLRPIVVVTRYTDIARDAVEARPALSDVERARVAELIAEGNGLVHQVRQGAQRKHEIREANVARLFEIGTELRGIADLAGYGRRTGIPLVEANRTQVGWTVVGLEQDGIEILRTRFIRPGSAYVTIKNATDAPRPFAIGLTFTDVVGGETGTGASASRPNEDLRAGEVREVLVQIVPSQDRFWDLTTDYSVNVQ